MFGRRLALGNVRGLFALLGDEDQALVMDDSLRVASQFPVDDLKGAIWLRRAEMVNADRAGDEVSQLKSCRVCGFGAMTSSSGRRQP